MWRHFTSGLAIVAEMSKSEAAVIMNRLVHPDLPVKSVVIVDSFQLDFLVWSLDAVLYAVQRSS